ncbi:alpha/beta fold hydrolase [Neiella marina]|uniref:Alpha/beta fold hydrolase n=1 Tax=Neiella holothuriorum TaxID=2870530 RepID=A0ABS7EBT7_9GAMM|nr:alpha/beta fold hydrolase [Neiella holothuriorum]MBW8189790.1 alpha/beta fold hydrolase [Neiella holothuriorum]
MKPAWFKYAMNAALLILWVGVFTKFAVADERQILLDNGTYQIPVIVNTPATKGPAPLVLMLHGTAGQKNEVGNLYQRLAERLAAQGIASARFDFAGTGDSPVDYRYYTLTSAVGDAQTVLRYCLDLTAIDGERVGVVGFSQGGLIAQLLVTDPATPSAIKVLAGWSSMTGNGVSSFADFYQTYYPEAKRNGVASVKFEWRDAPLNFSRQWFEELAANTSFDRMRDYQGQLLLIAGGADDVVTPQHSVALQQAATNAKTELHIVEGANHLFNVIGAGDSLNPDQTKAEQLLQLTQDWFQRQL